VLTISFLRVQVRKFVIRREVQPKGEGKKPYTKAPKIQRLITPQRLQHKRHRVALKRRNAEKTKDAAVCPSLPHIYYHTNHRRTSMPQPSPSVFTKPRNRRPTFASVVLLPCASKARFLAYRFGMIHRQFI
jgi:hypothetical protein